MSNTCCRPCQKTIALHSSRLSRSCTPYKAEGEENELCLSSCEHFFTSLRADSTTSLINDLPPSFSNPVSREEYCFFFSTQPWLQMTTPCFSVTRERQKTSWKQIQEPPLLPLGDSQLQRSISSALKDGVSSGVGRSSVSGLPVDTFKDFTHMSLLLKYF